ncbi:D-Ala-D-Ala carboxypeptidase family metallohydrolase [Pseudomonas sp.]|uniref:D-Ala-D-Ala carboxypeptidase family metallohydrolase n=1 Tax=Pseudomonas sp. TaxID=306 RepID=UPI001A0E3CCC|nr:D-Ala-D-Ala carboxypeptidase family metallohydrolase [Pseudomonas sp.]MBF0675600.1 peptidase M15A [Pseudomonas sp.]
MQLTRSFTLAELERSDTARSLRLDNGVPAELLPSARRLAEWLQALRDRLSTHMGRSMPIIITSGYRGSALNKAVGGSATSAHCCALAADFHVPGLTIEALFQFIKRHMADMPADQVIQEFGQWIHVGLAESPREQYLLASKVNGKTVYEVAA